MSGVNLKVKVEAENETGDGGTAYCVSGFLLLIFLSLKNLRYKSGLG